MPRAVLAASLLLLVSSGAGAALAAPVQLPDSTLVDRWTLPNGLDVVTREVPGASAISVTWAYRYGLDYDTANEPALALLLAQVAFTAAAGDVPERTPEEMESLRPEGWNLKVNRRQTFFTETARPEQLAGVLRQVATRMRGITVSEPVLSRARAAVRSQLRETYLGSPEQMLYWQAGACARGLDESAIAAFVAARGLDRETPASVQQAIARVFAPANGVLVLAGDLHGLDYRTALAEEFGSLPAGARLAEPPAAELDSSNQVRTGTDVARPIGVLAVGAPALSDSLQPAFYMAMLVLGTQAKETWGPSDLPSGTRFQYSVLDDPDIVRFYPPIPPAPRPRPAALSAPFASLVDEAASLTVPLDVYEEYRHNLIWLLGGPMGRGIGAAVRRDPAALNLLCVTSASRALWGSESFWATYRRRFSSAQRAEPGFWAEWLKNPAHQARLLLLPRR